MRPEFSTPDRMSFFDNLRSWILAQEERLWIAVPFVDELGVSLLNSSARANDSRLVTRKAKVLQDLNTDKVSLRILDDLHAKYLLGDTEVYVGSPNLTYASLLNNVELLFSLEDQDALKGLEDAFLYFWES